MFINKKCKHPFKNVFVRDNSEVISEDEDSQEIKYKLFCSNCGKNLNLNYTKLKGGVSEFLNEGGVLNATNKGRMNCE